MKLLFALIKGEFRYCKHCKRRTAQLKAANGLWVCQVPTCMKYADYDD